MGFAETPNARLWYEEGGNDGADGAPVLLIMGLGVKGSGWVHQVEDLCARHRVVWYDNRGVGQSSMPPGPWKIADMAHDALGLLDHLEWEAAHVVGVSLGGMVAQEVALAARSRLRSLTLIATTPGRALPPLRGLRVARRAKRAPDKAARLDAMKDLLFPAAFARDADPEWMAKTLEADFGDPPDSPGRTAQLRAAIRHNTARRLRQLAGLPTLVIEPGKDILVRPSQSRRLQRLIPGARRHVFAEAGHGVIRQVPDALNKLLLDHFAQADVAAQG